MQVVLGLSSAHVTVCFERLNLSSERQMCKIKNWVQSPVAQWCILCVNHQEVVGMNPGWFSLNYALKGFTVNLKDKCPKKSWAWDPMVQWYKYDPPTFKRFLVQTLHMALLWKASLWIWKTKKTKHRTTIQEVPGLNPELGDCFMCDLKGFTRKLKDKCPKTGAVSVRSCGLLV